MKKRIVTALFALVAASPAIADGVTTYAAQCAACHGEAGRGTKMGPPIAGMAVEDVKYAIKVGGGRKHTPGVKWQMKPVKVADVDAVALYVAELKN